MKKFSIVIIGLLVSMVLLTACGSQKVEVSADMNGQTISLNKGDRLVLSLESNPTTGFDWELQNLDESVIKLVGEPDYKTDSKLMGAAGVKTYTFEAQGSGKTSIKLVYHRSWETDVPPEKEFEIFVDVN
jgi:inhibitor of cysteine peptidase